MAKQSLPGFRGLGPVLIGLIGCGLAAAALSAEVYKVVDENGRVTYTDALPRDKKAEKMELPAVNAVPATETQKRPSSPEPRGDVPSDYDLRISYPPDEFHVNPGIWNLNIQVAAEPNVHPRHQLQITDNGEVIEGTTMENIVVRGTHTIQARVVDQQGRVISQSEPIQVYVHRPTVRNQSGR